MKKYLNMIFLIVFALSMNSIAQTSTPLLLKIMPFGIGEISAGKGDFANFETKKGLGLLTSQVICVHDLLSSIGTMQSAAAETELRYKEAEQAIEDSEKKKIVSFHTTALENYDDAKINVFIFAGAFVGLWAFNVVDNFIFSSAISTSAKDKNISIVSSVDADLNKSIIGKLQLIKNF